MSQPARSGTRSLAALGLAAVVALVAGCYKPDVQSGGLTCATAPAKACPDGFTCVGTVCVNGSSMPDASAGSGGHGGTASGGRGGTGGRLGSGGMVGTGGAVSTGGVMGSGGSAPGQPRAVGETCAVTNAGTPDQSDNCVSGAVCAQDCAQSICFQTCNTDDDCPKSSCTRTTPSGTKICELTYNTCDPHSAGAQQGCDGTYCYLLSSLPSPGNGNRTVCDCPTDEKGLNEACSDSRECFPGLVCPPATMPGGGACRQACDPHMLLNTGCPLPVGCNTYGPSWGYCY